MAAVGGGGGGEDPNKHWRDFDKHWKSQPKLNWNPVKIGALPGGSKSVAVFLTWHGNAQVLCAHMVRYSKTPFFIVGVAVIGGVGGWYKTNRDRINAEQDNRDLQAQALRQEQLAAERNRLLEQQIVQQRQINEHLRQLNASWLEKIKKWFE